ncbi:hypothetical protein RUND412_006986 [Rhizina undulata]
MTLYLSPNELKFPAHYAILNTRTKYFNVAKERGFKEGVENEFRFKENSTHALYRVLQYVYTRDYSAVNNQLDDDQDDRELIKHPRVYAIADLRNLSDLKDLCKVRFQEQLTAQWISDTFVDAVREVYSSTVDSDRKLRDLLATVAFQNIKNPYIKNDFKVLLKENVEFASDLIKLWVTGTLA